MHTIDLQCETKQGLHKTVLFWVFLSCHCCCYEIYSRKAFCPFTRSWRTVVEGFKTNGFDRIADNGARSQYAINDYRYDVAQKYNYDYNNVKYEQGNYNNSNQNYYYDNNGNRVYCVDNNSSEDSSSRYSSSEDSSSDDQTKNNQVAQQYTRTVKKRTHEVKGEKAQNKNVLIYTLITIIMAFLVCF